MGEIEEVVEQPEPKKVEDIIKRYMESQQELMVLRRGFPNKLGNDYNLVY